MAGIFRRIVPPEQRKFDTPAEVKETLNDHEQRIGGIEGFATATSKRDDAQDAEIREVQTGILTLDDHIKKETQDRASSDNQIQSALSSEVTQRKNDDTILVGVVSDAEKRINASLEERKKKDADQDERMKTTEESIAVLDDHIKKEAQDRTSVDNQLQTAISTETADRKKKDDGLSEAIIAVDSTVVTRADERIGKWSKDQFGGRADGWWDQRDIHAKLSGTLDLPAGLVPEDVGEFLKIIQEIGTASPPPQQVITGISSGSSGGTTATQPGTGLTPTGSGISRTIPNVNEVRRKLYDLMVNLFDKIKLISGERDYLKDKADWVLGKKGGIELNTGWVGNNMTALNSIITWASSTKRTRLDQIDTNFNTYVGAIVDNKLSAYSKAADATTQAVGSLTTTSSDLGGGAPKDYIMDTVSFWYKNFRGKTLDSIIAAASGIPQWVKDAHNQGVVSYITGNVIESSDAGQRKKINDRIDAWMVEGGFAGGLTAGLTGFPWYNNLAAHASNFPKITKAFDGVSTVKDAFGDLSGPFATMKTDSHNLRDKLMALKTTLESDIAKIQAAKKGMTDALGNIGASWQSKATATEAVMDRTIEAIQHLKDGIGDLFTGFDKIGDSSGSASGKFTQHKGNISGKLA